MSRFGPRVHEVQGWVALAHIGGDRIAWPVPLPSASIPWCISPSSGLQKGPWIYFVSVYRIAPALSSSPVIVQLRLKCQSFWLPAVDTCLSAC